MTLSSSSNLEQQHALNKNQHHQQNQQQQQQHYQSLQQTQQQQRPPQQRLLPDKPDAIRISSSLLSTSMPGGVSFTQQGFYESQPIYANSSDVESSASSSNDVAYSEGSITPTNAERSSSPPACGGKDYPVATALQLVTKALQAGPSAQAPRIHRPLPAVPLRAPSTVASHAPSPKPPAPYPKEIEAIYASSGRLSRSGRPPPPPPARRTSSISNPNAITLGTLRSAGCSTYEEIRTLKRSASRSMSHVDAGSTYAFDSEPIYSNIALTLETNGITNNKAASGINKSYSNSSSSVSFRTGPLVRKNSEASLATNNNATNATSDDAPKPSSISTCSVEFMQARAAFATLFGNVKKEADEHLPPPPPEAYAEDGTSTAAPATSSNSTSAASSLQRDASQNSHSYNRISNIHRDFLQTLNTKLAISHQQRLSPRVVKRRSMSVGEHDWDSDSGIVSNSSCSTTSSISSNSQPNSLQQSLMRLMGTRLRLAALLVFLSQVQAISRAGPQGLPDFQHRHGGEPRDYTWSHIALHAPASAALARGGKSGRRGRIDCRANEELCGASLVCNLVKSSSAIYQLASLSL